MYYALLFKLLPNKSTESNEPISYVYNYNQSTSTYVFIFNSKRKISILN